MDSIALSREIMRLSLDMVHRAKASHVGSALSIADIVVGHSGKALIALAYRTATCAGMQLAADWLGSPARADVTLHIIPLWSMKSNRGHALNMVAWDSDITIEDHLAESGFGSGPRASLQDAPHLMARLSVRALYAGVSGMVGSQSTLNAVHGLSAPT